MAFFLGGAFVAIFFGATRVITTEIPNRVCSQDFTVNKMVRNSPRNTGADCHLATY
jgi:hypothetical protein